MNRISPHDDRNIPNFHLQGNPNLPEILSNKLVLTPVAPGNQRGAVWADRQLMHTSWVTDVDFRANGPERGGGNLNIWLLRGGSGDVGPGSIYTVGSFDGLALVIDTHGGSGGMIRGFLNDGTTDYKAHTNVDSLAFGHCYYSYRNLGRPSQIKMRQSPSGFKVEIDGRLCFESDNISIPRGYHFGITAGSADNPDSFELFKLVVMSDDLHTDHSYTDTSHDANPIQNQQEAGQKPLDGSSSGSNNNNKNTNTNTNSNANSNANSNSDPSKMVADDPYDAAIPDQDPNKITNTKSQFADLHNRLQGMNHHVTTIFRSVSRHAQMSERRHMEMSKMIDDLKTELRRFDSINDLQNKITNLEKEIRSLRSEMSQKVKDSEHAVKSFVSDHHSVLSDNIASNAPPGHGRLIFIVIGSQVTLAGVYILYKRRKNSMPKKYL
jgi:lectin, mannose-binding 1